MKQVGPTTASRSADPPNIAPTDPDPFVGHGWEALHYTKNKLPQMKSMSETVSISRTDDRNPFQTATLNPDGSFIKRESSDRAGLYARLTQQQEAQLQLQRAAVLEGWGLAALESSPDPTPITPTFFGYTKVTSHNVGSWFHDVLRDVSW